MTDIWDDDDHAIASPLGAEIAAAWSEPVDAHAVADYEERARVPPVR